MKPFVVLSLPRSRSYWLSKFLQYGDYQCGHDQARYARSLDDVRSWLGMDFTGTCETAGARWWRVLRAVRPDSNIVVVRRPVGEVVDSLMALPLHGILNLQRGTLERGMTRLDRCLDKVAKEPGVLSVQYHDLWNESVCERVFEHCLPYAHDSGHWHKLKDENLQLDMRARMRYYLANARQISGVGSALRSQMRTLVKGYGAPQRNFQIDGVSFQQEQFETFWRDGQELMSEHCEIIGEEEDQFQRKNVPLFRTLDSAGSLHIMTARLNGKMFGYLISLLGPSMEHPTKRVATQATFFASKDAEGMRLGMRLQKASIESLRGKGINEVMMYAGIRGSGPKLGVLYKRLGAKDVGDLYKLTLKAA